MVKSAARGNLVVLNERNDRVPLSKVHEWVKEEYKQPWYHRIGYPLDIVEKDGSVITYLFTYDGRPYTRSGQIHPVILSSTQLPKKTLDLDKPNIIHEVPFNNHLYYVDDKDSVYHTQEVMVMANIANPKFEYRAGSFNLIENEELSDKILNHLGRNREKYRIR